MQIKQIELGMLEVNCYLLTDEISGESAIVDPSVYNASLQAFIDENKIKTLKYIILTHGHFDHILGVKELKEKYGAKVAIHKEDAPAFFEPERSFASPGRTASKLNFEPDIILEDGSVLCLGGIEIKVMHTPGHSAGSVCLFVENAMISGDTVFWGSIGRTDFAFSSPADMLKSLAKIRVLNEDYTIYPGHGPSTTLASEKLRNPYLMEEFAEKCSFI